MFMNNILSRCIDHLSVFVHMCIGNQSCDIYIHMCIHHPSSLITVHDIGLLINTHMYSVFCLHAQIIRPSVLAKKATHISMSAGDTTTHWDNFRSGATDVSDEYDNVCICSHQIHCGCIGFSSLSQVGRWLILCAPAVCSWSKKGPNSKKCPAELSNH